MYKDQVLRILTKKGNKKFRSEEVSLVNFLNYLIGGYYTITSLHPF